MGVEDYDNCVFGSCGSLGGILEIGTGSGRASLRRSLSCHAVGGKMAHIKRICSLIRPVFN